MADDFFLENRIQHTFHRPFHIRNSVVDDTIQAQIHFLPLCGFFCRSVGFYIKSNNNGAGRACQRDIGFVDRAHGSVDTFYHYLFVGQFKERLLDRLHRTRHVCFDHKIQFF